MIGLRRNGYITEISRKFTGLCPCNGKDASAKDHLRPHLKGESLTLEKTANFYTVVPPLQWSKVRVDISGVKLMHFMETVTVSTPSGGQVSHGLSGSRAHV